MRRRRAGFRLVVSRQFVLTLGRRVEGFAQILTIEGEAALLLRAELDRYFDGLLSRSRGAQASGRTMLTLLSKMSVQLPQRGSLTASLRFRFSTIRRLSGWMREVPGQGRGVRIAIDDELGIKIGGDLDLSAKVAIFFVGEVDLADTGARLRIRRDALPVAEGLEGEAIAVLAKARG